MVQKPHEITPRLPFVENLVAVPNHTRFIAESRALHTVVTHPTYSHLTAGFWLSVPSLPSHHQTLLTYGLTAQMWSTAEGSPASRTLQSI